MKKIEKMGIAFAFSVTSTTLGGNIKDIKPELTDRQVLKQLSFLDLNSPEVSTEIAGSCGETLYTKDSSGNTGEENS